MKNYANKLCIASLLLACLVSIPSLCFSQSSLNRGDAVPSWIKIKFYQSYGYSWNAASIEQQTRFATYCERMKKQWKKEDAIYIKQRKKADVRLKSYKAKEARLQKYLQTRKRAKLKKDREKMKQQTAQKRNLKKMEHAIKTLLPKTKGRRK